jgi:hypothetical protein
MVRNTIISKEKEGYVTYITYKQTALSISIAKNYHM